MEKTKWVKSNWSWKKISVADCQTAGWTRRDDQNELFHISEVWALPALLTEVTTLRCESGKCLAVSRKEKITFPIHVWDGGGGNVPIGSAGAESGLHENFYLPNHTFSANSKTENLEVLIIHSHSLSGQKSG